MRPPQTPDAPGMPSEAHTYALLGALCGAGLALAGWTADMFVHGLAPGLEALATLHRTNPLHWVLDLAAPALAVFGWVFGREREALGDAVAKARKPVFDLAGHVLSYTTEPILVLDPSGDIVTATPAVQRLLGWDVSQLTGQPADVVLCDYFSGRSTPRPLAALTGEIVCLEWRGEARRPSGRCVPIVAHSLPGAAPSGLRVVALHDATALATQSEELRNLRQERASLRQQVAASHHSAGGAGLAFFAKQVHELRNPLAVITALSAFVLEQVEQRGIDDLTQDMADMVTAADRLHALVDRTLDLSKIEAGRMSVLLEPVEVQPLVEELITQHRPVAAERRNGLALDVIPGVGRVFADPMRLRQVLENLLSNACKFTKDGRITLRVERAACDGPLGPQILFHVTDTGIGMTTEQTSRVFKAFEQGSSETRRDYGGTGLGLALVHRFVGMMSGEVQVQSARGAGTTFTVALPGVMASQVASDSAA